MLLQNFSILINKIMKDKDFTITLQQMLSRLLISLAQVKTENNSEKLKS